MNQIESARRHRLTADMRHIARDERMDPAIVRESVARGTIVIPRNKNHRLERVCGIGKGLRTKVNANIGTSLRHISLRDELKKLATAIGAGADAVMDLSTGGDLVKIRRAILKESSVPIGTVPIYEAAVAASSKAASIADADEKLFFDVLRRQAADGVDFFTIHAGVTLETVGRLKEEGRVLDVVSRGGALLVEWMIMNKRENPYYERFDEVIAIAREFDITLSLGDGLRPGAIADGTDRAQVQELLVLGELAARCRAAGVQVMIEGPGHLPLNEITLNVQLEKSLCDEAPFYVLGPLVTDIAPGYDHITGAIGGAIAASAGADFLCYVTPSEHVRLPSIKDVEEGVIASRIAAHAADIVKKVPGALERDIAMSQARKRRDWKSQFALALDPKRPVSLRKSSVPDATTGDVCTMCDKFCSMKIIEKCLHQKGELR
ncbi:MAG: phosphomethylpyrimidine synthase ThiC [Candidatus Omnitrophota bacterium]